MKPKRPAVDEHGVFSLRPGARWIPRSIQQAARSGLVRYRHRGLTCDDLLLVSFPRSGSTWLRFILATALTSCDLGYDDVNRIFPDVGGQAGAPPVLPGGGRLVKSHEARSWTPASRTGPRVVYLVRDGRDVAVSLFHFFNRVGVDVSNFDDLARLFAAGRTGPYGSWQSHVLGWLSSAGDPQNMLVIRYEDLLADALATLNHLDRVFGLAIGEQRLANAIATNSPASMRSKETGSARMVAEQHGQTPFVRAAGSGGWHEMFDPAPLVEFERQIGEALIAAGYRLSSPHEKPRPESTPR